MALKKLTGAFSCMHKGPTCFQSLWDHPKKFLLCKSTKKSRYVRSLGKKPHFEAFSEAKKANWRSRLHAQRSKMHSIPLGSSDISKQFVPSGDVRVDIFLVCNRFPVNILQVICKIFFGIIFKRTIFNTFPWCFDDAWLNDRISWNDHLLLNE